LRIARKAAFESAGIYSYLPTTEEEAEYFIPHFWVLKAMKNAVKEAQGV